MEFNQRLYKKRQRSNAVGLTLSLGAMVLGLFVLLWILSVLLSNGFAALAIFLSHDACFAARAGLGGVF